jgi:hypothetical protein
MQYRWPGGPAKTLVRPHSGHVSLTNVSAGVIAGSAGAGGATTGGWITARAVVATV